MIDITKYAKIFGKKPANFLDNPRIQRLIAPDELQITLGRSGGTLLDEKHAVEFLLWLHRSTRVAVTRGYTAEQIFAKLDQRFNLGESQ